MTQEERDIELIRHVIDTNRYDGIEYFHTYKGIKYYRYYCSAAQGGHTGWPFFAYIKNGKVEIVEDIEDTISISIDKLNHTQ